MLIIALLLCIVNTIFMFLLYFKYKSEYVLKYFYKINKSDVNLRILTQNTEIIKTRNN